MLAASLPAYAGETITLSDLLGEARAKNPALSAMQYRYEAGRQQVSQAGAFPDPMLEFGIQNLPVNSFSFSKDDDDLEDGRAVPDVPVLREEGA